MLNKPIRDKVAISVISGTLGTLVMYLFGMPLYFLKVSKIIYLMYSIELFVKPEIARTTFGFIAGMITGLIVGSVLAFGFKLLLEWTGWDWYWLKSFGYGTVMWFLWVGIARNFLDVTNYLDKYLLTNMILLSQSIIYSVSTAYFMQRLWGKVET
ncbi:MAG: hypothetical protein ACOYVD_07775 [Bacillota bacterium]